MEACRIYQIEKPVLKKTRQTANWIRSERTEKFSFIFFFSVVNFTEWFRLFQIHWFGDKFNPRKGSCVPQKDIWHPTFLSSDFSFLFHRFFFFVSLSPFVSIIRRCEIEFKSRKSFVRLLSKWWQSYWISLREIVNQCHRADSALSFQSQKTWADTWEWVMLERDRDREIEKKNKWRKTRIVFRHCSSHHIVSRTTSFVSVHIILSRHWCPFDRIIAFPIRLISSHLWPENIHKTIRHWYGCHFFPFHFRNKHFAFKWNDSMRINVDCEANKRKFKVKIDDEREKNGRQTIANNSMNVYEKHFHLVDQRKKSRHRAK